MTFWARFAQVSITLSIFIFAGWPLLREIREFFNWEDGE